MKALDKIIGSKKEIEEQEYPEEFEPNVVAKTGDPDIKEFLRKKQEREAKKDGKEDPAQDDILEKKEEVPGVVPESLEESKKEEEIIDSQGLEDPSTVTDPEQKPIKPKITYTRSFNMPVNGKNIETTKRILSENAKSGFVIALQAGTYVDTSNVENIKRVLKYFVNNNFKVVIVTEEVQEIADDKRL